MVSFAERSHSLLYLESTFPSFAAILVHLNYDDRQLHLALALGMDGLNRLNVLNVLNRLNGLNGLKGLNGGSVGQRRYQFKDFI